MIYSLHYLKRTWLKKPALSVTNYVTVTHGLACTLRMRKTISPWQWQPWTTVSPLLGQKVCLIQLARTSHWPKTSAYPFEYFKRYITHTDCQLSFNRHLKRLTHPLQGQLEGLSNQLISLYKAYKTARLSIVRVRHSLLIYNIYNNDNKLYSQDYNKKLQKLFITYS